ncbi:MAG: hypothetical protein SGBAC_013168, partial [Bacillariaceae sp.]
MTLFSSVDVAGTVSSGSLPPNRVSSKDETRQSNAQASAKSESYDSSDGLMYSASGMDKEEFHRLLSTRDSRLKREMQHEMEQKMQVLQEEIALLRSSSANTNGSPNIPNPTAGNLLCTKQVNFSDQLPVTSGPKGKDDDDEEEGIDLPLLPEDTFSYIAFSKWKSTSMLTAISVLAVQVTTLSVLALDFASTTFPGNTLGVPVSVNARTATIQVIALFIIVFSQGDLQDSLNLLFMGYDKEELENNLHLKVSYTRWLISLTTRLSVTFFGLCITFVMIVRESDVTQLLLDFTSIEFVTNLDNIFFWLTAWGYLGLSAQRDATTVVQAKAPVLVQEDIEDVLISTEKVQRSKRPSQSGEFHRAEANRRRRRNRKLHVKKKSKKYVNPHAAVEGLGVDLEIPEHAEPDIFSVDSFMTTERDELRFGEEHRNMCYSRFPRFLFLATIYFTMLAGWAVNFYWQQTGTFVCGTIFVQFNDIYHPGLATFSGLFDSRCGQGDDNFCKRASYVEVGHGIYSETARFFFCEDISAWVFAFDEQGQFNCDSWITRSPDQDVLAEPSYNILKSVTGNEPWSIKVGDQRQLPMPEFTLECYDCKHDEMFCGGDGRGKCVNNRCVCEDGWYGYKCDYFMPCEKLEVDPLHSIGGSRTWAGSYRLIMAPTNSDGDDGGENTTEVSTKLLTKYNRPTYIGGGLIAGRGAVPVEVIVYNGRRWTNIVQDARITYEQVQQFLVSGHGYWTNYTVSFLTGAVDVNTPEDSSDPSRLDWMEANPETVRGRVQGPNLQNNQIDLRLLCASCNNETNPCFYKGTCTAKGDCICEQGDKESAGTLCQIPPSGNGFCDVNFNTPQFNFDGGDCCEGTCVSTVEKECGVVEQSTTSGSTLAFVGFPNCTDPDAVKQVSGSQTLFNILERGEVICGTYQSDFLTDFFAAQCQAIAAAILGDKDAFSIGLWGSA